MLSWEVTSTKQHNQVDFSDPELLIKVSFRSKSMLHQNHINEDCQNIARGIESF